MQAFYFDMFDGEKVILDRYGDEFESVSDAADQAAGLLADLVRETLPSNSLQDFGVAVRDDLGTDVYRATLIFRGQYADLDLAPGSRQTCMPLTTPDPTELIRQSRETRAAAKRISHQIRASADRLSDNMRRLAETLKGMSPMVTDLG